MVESTSSIVMLWMCQMGIIQKGWNINETFKIKFGHVRVSKEEEEIPILKFQLDEIQGNLVVKKEN